MLWAIGDSHGCFDALFSIVSHIKVIDEKPKIIFLGDYIDYGPSSKAILDFIMELDVEKVVLLGNHEDIMMGFYTQNFLFQEHGNAWFNGLGGQMTVKSLCANPKQTVMLRETSDFNDPSLFPIDEKYFNFIKSMPLHHVEKIGDQEFIFTHAPLSDIDYNISEVLSLKNCEDFQQYLKDSKLWIERSFLWSKNEPVKRYNNYINIYGHVPTLGIKRKYKHVYNYDPEIHDIFVSLTPAIFPPDVDLYGDSSEYGPFVYPFKGETLIGVDIDTSCVYGKKLTALGIEYDEEKNKPYLFRTLYFNNNGDYRSKLGVISSKKISFEKFS